MMTLIVGGSGSGKSACAEDIMCGISDVNEKYYLATMQVYDEDGQKKWNVIKDSGRAKGF